MLKPVTTPLIILILNIWFKENFEVDIKNDNESIKFEFKFKFKSSELQAYRFLKGQTCAFNYISSNKAFYESKNLQTTKRKQENSISTKSLKKKSEPFAQYFNENKSF